MKKILLSVALLTSLGLLKANAQSCSIGIPNVTNIVTATTTDSCFVTFDLSFAMKNNNGNKTIGIDLWEKTNYVRPPYANVPSVAQLSGSLGSIMINNNFTGSPVSVTYYSTYPSDPSGPSASKVRLLRTGAGTRTYNASVDSFYFNITGIKLAVKKSTDGSCPVSLLTVKGDVWATNAGSYNANTSVQCVSSIEFSLGNPTVPTGFRNCTSPRTLSFSIETSSPTNITVSYKIYKDDNSFIGNVRTFNTSTDVDVTLPGTMPITDLRFDNPFVGTNIGYIDNNLSEPSTAYWVVVYYTMTDGTTYSVSRLINNLCATNPLPVNFKAFTATKANGATALKWTTSTEINNKGFYVQRFYNGQWENIMFIATKADGGNSTADLNYSYSDNVNFKGVVQYRILQVDIDGKAKYSMVRSVSNGSQAGSISVYPNPAPSNANVSIVLADATATYDIQIVDNAGRIIKEFSAVRNTQQISNLPKGQYLVRVKERESNQVSVEKFIVQ